MTETFYDLLGVAADANDDEIERAYRRRIKETHPDVNDDPDASERTARLVEARDVLTDAEERARYDRLGHDAYVGGEFGAAGGPQGYGDPTAAAEQARSGDRSDSGPTNARAGAEERRRRERRARRDVDFGSTAERTETGTGGASAGGTQATANGGTASAAAGPAGGAATTKGRTTVSDTPPPWSNTSDGWAARSPTAAPPGLANQVLAALREAPATAMITFILYPLLVLGTFFPAFPLAVNVVVGACLLASVAAIQSVAGLGVAVYGAWTVLGTIGLVLLGQSPVSPLGLVVLGTTWLPLGFSLLTSHALDR